MQIRQATIHDLDLIVPLFDGYRTFYKQPSDLDGARTFLKDRILANESWIYIALDDEKAVGFTQVYPLFSSVSMERMLVLNDLYLSCHTIVVQELERHW